MAKSLLMALRPLYLPLLWVGGYLGGNTIVFLSRWIGCLSGIIEPYLTSEMIQELTCVGSLLIIGIALNMLKVTDLKIMNYVPALL